MSTSIWGSETLAHEVRWQAAAASVTIHPMEMKARLVVALVFVVVVALIVIAGLIALASPAK